MHASKPHYNENIIIIDTESKGNLHFRFYHVDSWRPVRTLRLHQLVLPVCLIIMSFSPHPTSVYDSPMFTTIGSHDWKFVGPSG